MSHWHCQSEFLAGGDLQYRILDAEGVLSFGQVLQLWRESAEFRQFFIHVLALAPLVAYRFETPPLTTASAEKAFEFVLLDAAGLDRPADRQSFADLFAAHEDVLVFRNRNLGGDAELVIPTPRDETASYVHLASFSRTAPGEQQHALWQLVAEAAEEKLCDVPFWLSTAGGGVAWLHVRLDDRPKYYGYAAYRAKP